MTGIDARRHRAGARKLVILLACAGLAASACLAAGGPPAAAQASAPAAAISVGLLPVNVSGNDELLLTFRGLVDSALDTAAAQLPNADVVDRSRIGKVLNELALSKIGRTDLQAGQIVGAEFLVACELRKDKSGATLELSALETATGTVVLSRQATLADESDAAAAVGEFMAALPAKLVRPAGGIDVALLPITHTSPFPEKGGLAEGLRTRLAGRLAAVPGIRLLNRELAQFLLVEAQLAAGGLVDAKRRFAPVAGAVTVRGDLDQRMADGASIEQSQLSLELTVRSGDRERTVRASGTLAEAAEMELSAARDLAAAIAELAGRADKVDLALDDADRRYWEAQMYLAQAGSLIDIAKWEAEQNRTACDLMARAAALIPESPEPYELASRADYQEFVQVGLRGNAGQTQLTAIRRRFIDGFPRHRLWPHAVMVEIYTLLGMEMAGPLRPGQVEDMIRKHGRESYEQASALAEKLADATIARRAAPTEGFEVLVPVRLLLLDGQPEKALRTCEAAADHMQLGAWFVFNGYTVFAIDLGQFDWAYKATQIQLKRQPGYEVRFLNQSGRMEKLRTDPDFDRWKPILAAAEKKAQDRRKAEAKAAPPLPPWGDTQLVQRRALPPEKLASHRVPRGWVMSLSTQGGPLLAVLRDGNTYFLWAVGVADPVELKGLPPLVPPGQIKGYVMRPSIAWFEDKVWIGAEHLGLFVVDPADGRTEQVKDGFPDGSVHALAVEDKFLFAAGGGKEAGFIARREAGTTEWKTWMAPPFCGPVRRIAGMPRPRPGPAYHVQTPFGRMQMAAMESLGYWPVYHVESQRLSEFQWKTGQWSKSMSVEKYSFQPSCAAACGSWTLFFETGWDTQDPMYMADRADPDGGMLAVFFPPANLSEYSAILDRHRAAWSIDRQRRATMAPLADHPVDVVAVDDCLWVLDAAGGLTATRDGQSFAGPYMVAKNAQSMCSTAEALAVVAGRDLVMVPRKLLADKLAEEGAWRSAADVQAEVAARLKAWIEARSPEEQVAYFVRIRRPDLGAAVIAAHPELDRALVVRSASEQAVLLIQGGKYAEALAVVEPHCRTPREVHDNDLEWDYLWALKGTQQWQRILDVAPQLWLLVSPEEPISIPDMLNPYFHAVRATASKEEFEKVLWQHVRLERPVVTWRWDDNEVTKRHAWHVRYVAAGWLRELLKQEGRLKEIEGHPLIPEE